MADAMQEIRLRWEKATRGPWLKSTPDWGNGRAFEIREFSTDIVLAEIEDLCRDDKWNAEAIAAAPTDIATLLAAYDAQRAEIDRLREQVGILEGRALP